MDYAYFQRNNRQDSVDYGTNNSFYFVDASTNYNVNQGYHDARQTTNFQNGGSTYNFDPPETQEQYEDDLQQAIRASLSAGDEALRLNEAGRSSSETGDRKGEIADDNSIAASSSDRLSRHSISWDARSDDPSPFSSGPPSSWATTPPPAYESLDLQSTNDLASQEIGELPATHEEPPSEPPTTAGNKPLPASEQAFRPRKPLDFLKFKKDNHLHGSHAVRAFEAELDRWERRCHVGGCKDKRVHRTIQVERKGKKWEDGWGGYHRRGPKKVDLRVDSNFCEAHTCRSGGAGRNGKFCKCPKYPWAKHCTCCSEAGRLE